MTCIFLLSFAGPPTGEGSDLQRASNGPEDPPSRPEIRRPELPRGPVQRVGRGPLPPAPPPEGLPPRRRLLQPPPAGGAPRGLADRLLIARRRTHPGRAPTRGCGRPRPLPRAGVRPWPPKHLFRSVYLFRKQSLVSTKERVGVKRSETHQCHRVCVKAS